MSEVIPEKSIPEKEIIPDTIASAEELFAASKHYRKLLKSMDRNELIIEWLEWFEKRGEKLLKEAVRKGYFSLELDLPFQARNKEECMLYKKILRNLQYMLPNCHIQLTETEYEDEMMYKVEIDWSTDYSLV
jgi:hypothetical protein